MRWPNRTNQKPQRPAGRLLYLYSSSEKIGLNAFTAADDVSLLPATHGPWVLEGSIAADARLPHGLSRRLAEDAIRDRGFALWRMKPDAEATA